MATSSLLKQEDLDQLPKEIIWESHVICQWKGFWYRPKFLEVVLDFQSHFEASCDDVILASSMKTGTTWLKALCASIMNLDDELQQKSPHECTRSLELIYGEPTEQRNLLLDLSGKQSSPRLFHTHIAYSALPDSIKNSDCKIVYVVRNPKDTVVSLWHFFNKVYRSNQEPYPFEKAYDEFCKGFHPFGPFLDHALQYWYESLKMPHKILFLKYEDLKRDPKGEVKRLASFLGRPFDNEDEVDKVIWRSSMDRLKNLEVNKNGMLSCSLVSTQNSSFFRLGVVGDWKNYFTPEMKADLDDIIRKKLDGSGLDLEA